MKQLAAIATLLVIASWSVVVAQQQEPSLKPNISAPRTEPPPRLLLEVVYSHLDIPTSMDQAKPQSGCGSRDLSV